MNAQKHPIGLTLMDYPNPNRRFKVVAWDAETNRYTLQIIGDDDDPFTWTESCLDLALRQEANYNTIAQLLAQVAAALSALESDLFTQSTWRADPTSERAGNLTNDDGRTIHLALEWHNENRLAITGYYPDPGDGLDFIPYEGRDRPPRITAAAARPPEQIAADILKRFLPRFTPLYEKSRQIKAQHLERKARERDMIDLALEIFSGEYIDADRSVRFNTAPGKAWGKLDCFYADNGTLSLALHSLTMDQAKAIAEIVFNGRDQ